MARWKFQLCPNRRGVIGVGYRLDPIGQAFEDRVNEAMPYPFGFHGVNKIVIRLGPSDRGEKDYVEELGVGQKQYLRFSCEGYNDASPAAREETQFVEKASRKLGWLDIGFPRSTTDGTEGQEAKSS